SSMATYRTSSCTNFASAFIFSSVECDEAVNDATFCWISGEATVRPLSRFKYQLPISLQLLKTLLDAPPGGNKETTICPTTPPKGGMSGSPRIPCTSVITRCH